MKKSLLALSVCAMALAATNASAEGLYGSVKGGISLASDVTFSYTENGIKEEATANLDSGMTFTGAIGYGFSAIRAELEYSYQKNDFDTLEEQGISVPFADGNQVASSFFANIYYDFMTGSPWTPFVGAGLGLVSVDINDFQVDQQGNKINASDDILGYQFMAGVAYNLSKNLALSVEYRFVASSDPDYEFEGSRVDGEFTSHNFLLGARLTF